MAKLLLFNKPFGVLSQFTAADGHPGLADYLDIPAVYPAGRLDRDSEGLLLLTDDGALQAQISNPRFKLEKTYLAQVEGEVSTLALKSLSQGITLKDGPTLPARAQRAPEPNIWPRVPPIRARKNIPTSWIELTIREGRNRQVRRMCAHVGFPVLRLVRIKIGEWSLGQLKPGEHQQMKITMPAQQPGSKQAPPTRRPRQKPSAKGKKPSP
ncbi:MAG: pseudouridine synthase [Gammaproteobacteria bacterium]|nr:pseudouridine synthase [Gammaproteobacteria bacterium]MBQ0840613.1 pseudouridine synthase [Gammaproteobacteria bacterium]